MSEDPTPTDGERPEELLRCYCRLDGLVDLLSRRYAMQVVCAVGALEPVRYGRVEAALGDVSSSTLSTRLSKLTEAGVLDREQHDTIPPQVEYSLTADGDELCERLQPLLEWIDERESAVETDDR